MDEEGSKGYAQRAASEGPRWTRAVEDPSAPIPEEIASELGRVTYVCKHGPADVHSLVDGLDPIHGGGVMLIRTKCCDKPRDRE